MSRLVYLISAFFIFTGMYGVAVSADDTKKNGYINCDDLIGESSIQPELYVRLNTKVR